MLQQKEQQKSGGLRRNSSVGINETRIAGLYDLEHTIGKGHFAVVKLARHVFTGEKVAVKVIDKTKLDKESAADLMQEVRCMKLVQHPNIVRLYEVIDTQTKLFLILELGDYDMHDYIMRVSERGGCKESEAQQYFSQIIKAIDYCHMLHVVHRDLKPENVVFFEKLGMVKLTDFGFSNLYTPGQQLSTSCGSLAYSAPEILLGDAYDAPAVDIWSLGVILYMLVCGRLPFQEANESETLTRILDCRYSIPDGISAACKELIQKMLVRDPTKRATLDFITKSPWVRAGDRGHAEVLPLLSRTNLSDFAHNTIVEQMVAGGIGSEDHILDAIDQGEYSYLTATYYLLAERVLAAQRVEQATRLRDTTNTTAFPEEEEQAASGSHQATNVNRSRSNSWRGPSGRRACTILKEESEEELSTYLRSSSRQSSRNSSPSVAMFGPTGLRSSCDRISPQQVNELLQFSRLSGKRAASPESRISSRSPSPPCSSGRASPSVSSISMARLKATNLLASGSAGMRKMSSSPHLSGIFEEMEETTAESHSSTFYTVQSHKTSFVSSGASLFTVGAGDSHSGKLNGALGRGMRSASTGFTAVGRPQKSLDSELPVLPERASSAAASNSPHSTFSALRTRPRTGMSPDLGRRFEQHTRFVARTKRSTSCSSSETSEDDTNERRLNLIQTHCRRHNSDDRPRPDDEPPGSGTQPKERRPAGAAGSSASGRADSQTSAPPPASQPTGDQTNSNQSAGLVQLRSLCVN